MTREERQIIRDARAARMRTKAEALAAQADKLSASQNRDPAFLTQPVQNNAAGRAFARQRDAARRKFDREMELRTEAYRLADEAARLKATPVRVKGDAAAEKERYAASLDIRVGDMVRTVYGDRRVAKVNAKSIVIDGFTGQIRVEKHLVSLVRRAAE